MKVSKLLVLGSMLFTVVGANAEGIWVKPVPTKTAFAVGDTMYLYNSGAKGFFRNAAIHHSWDSEAAVGDKGIKVLFLKGATEGEYEFKDQYGSTWKQVFISDSTETYVDRAAQGNYMWSIEAAAGEEFRLFGADSNEKFNKTNYPGFYFGVSDTAKVVNGNKGATSLLKGSEASSLVNWYCVKQADYAVYLKKLDAYTAAGKLKKALDEAVAKGIAVAAQQAVYNNTNSTAEQIDKATEEVRNLIAKQIEGQVSANDPKDLTNIIVNPDYTGNSGAGWSGTTPNWGNDATQKAAEAAEFYNKKFNFYQDIKNAPNGVYAVTVKAFYRAGGFEEAYQSFKNKTAEGELAKLYAKAGADSLNHSIASVFEGAKAEKLDKGSEVINHEVALPNDMVAGKAYFDDGRFVNTMFFATDNNEFRLGLKKDETQSNDWVIFDSWSLKYYGKSADAYKLWMKDVIKNAPNFDELPSGTVVTKGMIDAYKQLLVDKANASDKAAVIEADTLINKAAAGITANIEAWKAFQAAIQKGNQITADNSVQGDAKDDLADYLEFDTPEIIAKATLTTEEVKAETKKLLAQIDNVVKTCLTVDADVTEKFLVNPNYENGKTGWQGDPVVNGPSTNKCAEAYNRTFDIYQIVKDAPQGVYEVSLQGFYRGKGGNSVAWQAYQDASGAIDCPVSVYVNNNQTPIKNLYDEQVNDGELYQKENLVGPAPWEDPNKQYWYPNDMTNGGIAFQSGLYKSSAFGLVAKAGGELRLGIKGNVRGDMQWAIWDNFKMVYRGFKADVIKPELEKALTNANSQKDEKMAKDVKQLLTEAISAGEAAKAQTDGKVMFNALVKLYNANDSVVASKTLFANLKNAAETLNGLIGESHAAAATKTQAQTLAETVLEHVENCDITNANVLELQKQLAMMRTKLAIPEGTATDTDPQDLTNAIQTPNFDKAGANSIEGWQGATGYNFGNDDTQKSALAVEFFSRENVDLYQEIEGLPNGTYAVTMDGFYRMGDGVEDYKAYKANAKSGNAFLYAASGNVTSSVPLAHLAAGGYTEDQGYSGTAAIDTDNGGKLYVPNDIVSASNYFNAGRYSNTVIVKVTDGKLRIGVKKDKKLTSDWVIMDSFKLLYYGESSTKTPNGDATGIDQINTNGEAKLVEVYNLNGVRLNALQRGVNIVKMKTADGKTFVKKVIVK